MPDTHELIDIEWPSSESLIQHTRHSSSSSSCELPPIQEEDNNGTTEASALHQSSPTTHLPKFLEGLHDMPARNLDSHKDRCFDIAFHPNPKMPILASASEDSTLNLTDLESGEILLQIPHKSEVLRVSWSHTHRRRGGGEGAYLCSATANGEVRVWDVVSQQQQHAQSSSSSYHHRRPSSSSSSSSSPLKLEPLCELLHREGSQVYACKFVKDDSNLLLTAADDAVLFWDLETRKCVTNFHYSQLPGNAALRGFGGKARNPDNTCYVFDVCCGKLGPSQSNESVCVALSDGSVRIQDRRSGRTVATLQRTGIHLTNLELGSETGVLIACGGKGEATVYDVHNWQVRAVLHGHKGPVYGAQFVPNKLVGDAASSSSTDNSLVMTYSADCTLQFHDISAANESVLPAETLHHPQFPIYCAAFSPLADRLVLAGGTGKVSCCDGQDGEEVDREGGGGGHHHHHHHEEVLPKTLLCYDL